ncbi:AraC family transcriptional regulator [Bradyrhizobium oligotrophicum]
MKLSQSSKLMPDPLSNVLDALGARVTRRTRMEAAGDWALAFPAMDRLKFVAVLRGTGWMLLPSRQPQCLHAGDVCLLGRTPYVVASDPTQTPIDGEAFYGAPGCDVTRFGGDHTIGIGGTVTFAADNADFLLDMLPDFLLVSRVTPASSAIATILGLMNDELQRDRIGGEVVSARLADLLLVEAIRAYASQSEQAGVGWFGALSDPRLGRVLRAIHQDVSRRWTVEGLANVAGMSRAAFSATFTRRVGQPPLAYLRAWRLTIARAALARGDATVATIASKVGYESQSAFAHAFKREFGSTPKAGLA